MLEVVNTGKDASIDPYLLKFKLDRGEITKELTEDEKKARIAASKAAWKGYVFGTIKADKKIPLKQGKSVLTDKRPVRKKSNKR